MKKTSIAVACLLAMGASGSALADSSSDVNALKQQMAAMQAQMQQQMQQMQDKINTLTASQAQTQAEVQTQAAKASEGGLTANIGGAEVTLYGMADVSLDSGSNGKQHVSQASSNESYLGVRGQRDLGSSGLRAIFQIETMADLSDTPGVASSLASRNSFAGLEGSFGRVAIGKNDTPYKRATAAMDPFAGSLGDYNSVMGNSAGEGRTEFDYRMPHSVFYDSPNFGGFTVNALFSPGQKLNDLTSAGNNAFPQGELVCSGSQQPSLNGATPNGNVCNDGAFKNAASTSLTYENGPFLATAAWELHHDVNRTSDAHGVIADESAAKVGATYSFGFGNKLSGIYERLMRDGVNSAFNERSRNGYYLSDVQELGRGVDLMGAWAHADQTPGSPKFPGLDDQVDMYSIGLKYHFDKHTSVYVLGAYLTQGAGAHYGLGAGEGHGTPILSPRTNGGGPLPGQTLSAVSTGIQYEF
jgi:predicted porin